MLRERVEVELDLRRGWYPVGMRLGGGTRRSWSDAVRASAPLRAAAFTARCAREVARSRSRFDLAFALSRYDEWAASLNRNRNPLADERPWITFAAAHFLDNVVRKDMAVYEYGSGGSTLFLARRTRRVVSVEHDPAWRELVVARIGELGLTNVEVHLRERQQEPAGARADASDPDAFGSDDGGWFADYVCHIDAQPDASLDVVLVDGRSRPACLTHALPKVKPGGWLVLDNSERAYYARAQRRVDAAGWSRREFPGPGPHNLYFWKTTVWQRPR